MYKFKSKAAGDVIMLAPQGDALLRLIGREPADKGIIEPQAMAAAIAALQRAVAEDEAARAGKPDDDADGDASAGGAVRDAVSLRRRVWPMVEMLKRAQAENEPVVWGV